MNSRAAAIASSALIPSANCSDCNSNFCSAKLIDDDAGFRALVNTEAVLTSATGHHQAERSAGDSASKWAPKPSELAG